MKKLLVISIAFLLIAGLGAAKGASDSVQGEDVTDHPNTIDPETVDDIQAGKADSARKEIAVKIQDEEQQAREGGKAIIGKVDVDNNPEIGTDNERSARKGRNPQTGKEIKIPAKKVVKFKLGAELSEKIKTIKENEAGEEYFVHATGLIDEIRDEDDVSFEIREGRKGMNAVDVRRTD